LAMFNVLLRCGLALSTGAVEKGCGAVDLG
jgi:hypothetical protein